MVEINRLTEISQFLKSKGFTDRTIKTYLSIVKKVLGRIGYEFTSEQVELLLQNLNLSPRTYNLYRSIINFYSKRYLNKKISFSKAKIPEHLPNYVNKDEINKVIKATPNIKHKLGLALIYSSGLRSYELVRLKKHDIDLNNFTIWVRNGKGKKDRQTMLSSKVTTNLEIFMKSINNDNPYLFQTYMGHISERSFQEILKRGIKKSKLTKYFSLHDLRHSFAINLVNNGVDIEIVRSMLGHSSLRTTQIYLQCRTIKIKELVLKLEGDITH